MIRLDEEALRRCGLVNLLEVDKADLLGALYREVETRVGLRIAGRLSVEKLDEFEQVMEYCTSLGDADNADEAAIAWLEENVPDYKADVMSCTVAVIRELWENAPLIAHRFDVDLVLTDRLSKAEFVETLNRVETNEK